MDLPVFAEAEMYEDDARAGILEGLNELDRDEGIDAALVLNMLRARHNDAGEQPTA